MAATLLLAACAAAPRRAAPPPQSAETADVEQLYLELRNRSDDLHLLGSEGAPDCARIDHLTKQVCTLAERICRIAEKEPPGSTSAKYCEDGKARCTRATERSRRQNCESPSKIMLR